MSLSNDDHRPVLISRAARLSRISALIRSEQISSQAELARRLAAEGIVVSQGTLSRDLKDVGAARGRDQLGNFQYSIPEGGNGSRKMSVSFVICSFNPFIVMIRSSFARAYVDAIEY